MKTLLTIAFAFCFTILSAQEKIYYNDHRDKAGSKDAATWYMILSENKETGITTETCYTMSDRMYSINDYSDYNGRVREGRSAYYSPDGSPVYIEHYKNN